MPGTTTRGGFPYPLGTDPPDTDGDIRELAEAIAAAVALDSQGTLAQRPAPGQQGLYYYATDTGLVYRDSGTAWVTVGSSPDLSAYATDAEVAAALADYATTSQLTAAVAPKMNTSDANAAFLPIAGKAADSEKLDGFDSATAATANTVAVRGADGRLTVATPSAASDAATKGYADALIAGAAQVATGTYLGDDTLNRSIALPFTPKLVLVAGGAHYGFSRIGPLAGSNVGARVSSSAGATATTSNNAERPNTATNAFVVSGTGNTSPNGNLTSYNYIAIG